MDIRVEYRGAFFIFAALLCLTLPLPWVVAAVTAAMIHEIFHILAVLFFGGTIHMLTVGINGAVIDSSPMTVPQQLFCIVAGPMGSLLLILTGRFAPKLALCGFIQGMFNLMPLYPLDGGRAIRCMAEGLFPLETADIICKWIERILISLVVCFGIWASVIQKLGIAPILLSVLLISKAVNGKIPCKEGNLGVQ